MGTLPFVPVIGVIAIAMLIWACVEVGSNDAANLVNAVFGARVMNRKRAVLIAGSFVILGASFANPVMDTVRKGIFDLSQLDTIGAVSIFISAYLVNTVLLYSFSAYGLPVSTTATLVFSLAGGAIGVTMSSDVVNWATMSKVTGAILMSIIFSGFAGFIAQRIFRGAIRKDSQKHSLVLLHGPWITGLILTAMSWFMVVKGLKGIPSVKAFGQETIEAIGIGGLLFLMWGLFAFLTHLALAILGRKGTKYLFHFTSVLGMACMAFAFGQNDLANSASPGLAIWMIWKEGIQSGSQIAIPNGALFFCGFLIFLGMRTKRAQRVTRAEVNTASQQISVNLYAPKWCIKLAGVFVGTEDKSKALPVVAPGPLRDDQGKKFHYDPLRASVILAVSSCIIAFASGLGLPVSTTYVSFAAVIATGWGDRVFSRGEADLKVGRAIWVVSCWFLGMFLAAAGTAVVAGVISKIELVGFVIFLAINLVIRHYFSKKADEHDKLYHTKKDSPSTSYRSGPKKPAK